MNSLLILVCVGVGLLVGSFLNVVVWRVPRGESVVSPPSACPACGHRISPLENVPVLSWLVLRGRCRSCRGRISVRYPSVELATGAAFGVVAWWLGPSWELPAFLYLAAISIALSLIDIDVKRLPDVIVLPSIVVAAVLLAIAAIATGSPGRLVATLGGGAALFCFYFILIIIKPGAMGFGDVKLAAVLGQYLGFFGWATLVVGGFLGFLVGGLQGIALIARGKGGMKSKIPYGPFMIIGAWLAIFFGRDLTRWYLQLVGLT